MANGQETGRRQRERGGAVTLDAVSVRYPAAERAIVRDVSITIDRGERLLLTGASGSGKSTLLYTMAGIVPDVIAATIDGTVERKAERVGVVLQNPESQMIAPTVEEEVAFGLENLGMDRALLRDRVDEALARFGLQDFRHRPPQQLSGGECQKVALASALAHDPDLLFLDEPTAFLDPRATRELFSLLDAIPRSVTVIIVEHRIERVRSFVDSAVLMDESGGIGPRTPPDGLRSWYWFSDRASNSRKSAREEAPIPRAGDIGSTVPRPALQCKRVSHRYSGSHGAPALQEVTFELGAGSALAILGPNGSGKSTLLDKLSRILPVDREMIFVADWTRSRNVEPGAQTETAEPSRSKASAGNGLDDVARLRASSLYDRVYVVPQNPEHLFLKELVADELSIELNRPAVSGRRGDRPAGPTRSGVKSTGAERISSAAARFGLERTLERNPYTLSEGEKRRLTLACAFASTRPIVLFDEPTYGLDPHAVRSLVQSLEAVQRSGVTTIFTTHSPELACLVADELIFLRNGRVHFKGSPGDFLSIARRDPELYDFLPAWDSVDPPNETI